MQLTSNRWKTVATITMIVGNHPSLIGRDLMAQLGLQLVQKAPREPVMEIHEEQTEGENAGGENIWISGRTHLVSSFLNFLHKSVKSDIIRSRSIFLKQSYQSYKRVGVYK